MPKEAVTAAKQTGKLIRLQPILEVCEAALWSGRVQDESPLSLCLVARQQSAKSSVMIRYSNTTTVKVYTDVTSKPLLELRHEIESGRLRHIMLLDLHTIVSHNRYTTDRTLQILAGLMEEGLGSVADAGGVQEISGLPKIGVIMAVTPEFYDSKRGWWRKTGFLSRFLVVHYTYSDDTHARIHHYIREGGRAPSPGILPLPEKPIPVELSPKHMQSIEDMSCEWGELEEDPGYRYHRQLRKLLKSWALRNHHKTTTDGDFADMCSWTPFFRPSAPAEL